MRIHIAIVSVALIPLLVSCTHQRAKAKYWQGQSILQRGESIAALNARVNNPAKSQAERSKAVFTLFADYIRPGASAAEVHRVLGNATWLKDAKLYDIRELSGCIPVDWIPNTTAFCIHLFPTATDQGWSPWCIYFLLSGKGDFETHEGIREEQELGFLRGVSTSRHRKLLEFALCFPNSKNPQGLPGRIEIFSRQGIHVDNEWQNTTTYHSAELDLR